MALRTNSSWKGATTVWIARRSRGGVSISDMSRSPTSDMCNVRGIGVAESASASTFLRISFSRSLCATPKRCSSSTINSPRSANFTSFESKRCVPITTSTFPASRSARTFFCSAALRKRLSNSIRAGKAAKRFLKVSKCWKVRTVVGASRATCLLSITALNAARMATSVLP